MGMCDGRRAARHEGEIRHTSFIGKTDELHRFSLNGVGIATGRHQANHGDTLADTVAQCGHGGDGVALWALSGNTGGEQTGQRESGGKAQQLKFVACAG